MQPLRTIALSCALAVPAAVGLVGLTDVAAQADGAVYYVSPGGSDSASGTSPDTAWHSLARASQAQLAPGDRVELQGGATYSEAGGLTLSYGGTSDAPVVLESYGGSSATITGATGSCVTVRGSNIVVNGIVTTGCGYAGIEVSGDGVRVDGVESYGNETGVSVDPGASYTTINHSWIHSNTRTAAGTSGTDDDSGAFGVLVAGEHTTISGNTISGHDVASADYGSDGSAVEVFGADDTVITGNTAADNQTFVEVGATPGGPQSTGVLVQSNQVTSAQAGSYFVVVHAGDQFGSASGVQLTANSVHLSGAGTIGVAAGPSSTPGVLALLNNTIAVTQRAIAVGGTYSSTGDNVSP